jgi:ADP-heptose:LPS heptosyltransferase
MRIGTINRFYHLYTCNILLRLSRKNSLLHESQLNTKLLEPLGITKDFSLEEIASYYGFNNTVPLDEEYLSLIRTDKKKVIIHPKSKGSAKEWVLENFGKLIDLLTDQDYQVFISGTKEEAALLQDFIYAHPNAVDITGLFTLRQFISFINACDAMVAASTGPLHIASALGKKSDWNIFTKTPYSSWQMDACR